ncbi:MAG: tetratricopeptide repeat protein [Nitrospinae bacterium]|nr:tetratricopeptide repeat protein [Nitrospinota bacterium]
MKTSFNTRLYFLAVLWIAVWIPVMAVPANADSLGDAARAYQSGNYKKAFELLKPLAEQGNAAAQYNLAFMYERGKWVSQDYTTAATWYRKAAQQGHAKAQFFLGTMYQDGIGISQNHSTAATWFLRPQSRG